MLENEFLEPATTIGASVIQGRNYYNNGGSSWFVGTKLALDVGMSLVSNIGPIGAAIGFTYSMIEYIREDLVQIKNLINT